MCFCSKDRDSTKVCAHKTKYFLSWVKKSTAAVWSHTFNLWKLSDHLKIKEKNVMILLFSLERWQIRAQCSVMCCSLGSRIQAMLLGRKFVEVQINLPCSVWKRGFRIYGIDLEDSEKNAHFIFEAAEIYLNCIFKVIFITVLNLKFCI